MPIPIYVPKEKHKEYRRRHRELVLALEGKVQSAYMVATTILDVEYISKKNTEKEVV